MLLFSSVVLLSLSSIIIMASKTSSEEIKVGFLGNSIQYFNDSPRLLEQMLQSRFKHVQQNSCLRGGATLRSLWLEGNGMRSKFTSKGGKEDIGAASVKALLTSQQWDYVVINDYTQGPARTKSRHHSLAALEELYVPLLAQSNATPVFLQTAAYRRPTKGSDDLGSVYEFTKSLEEGYKSYATLLANLLPGDQEPIVAPVGQAYLHLHQTDRRLWERLFYVDDHHPSPHGTWLQACVLYCTLTGEKPPHYDKNWWKQSRYMMPDVQLDVPNPIDAETLRQVAIETCGLSSESQT
jgi:hypothetical protein